jgi:hypothetical protein
VTKDGESMLEISLLQCGVTPKDAVFDPQWPSGFYDMDMSFMRSRMILRALMRMDYVGKGKFLLNTIKRTVLNSEGKEESWKIDLATSDMATWKIPEDGWLTFEFQSNSVRNAVENVRNLSDRSMVALHESFKSPTDMKKRTQSLNSHISKTTRKILYRQAVQILSWFPDFQEIAHILKHQSVDQEAADFLKQNAEDTHCNTHGHPRSERVDFVLRVLPLLNSDRRDLRILEDLTEFERREVYDSLCMLVRRSVHQSFTGYYKFNLQRLAERDSCLQLVSITANEFCDTRARYFRLWSIMIFVESDLAHAPLSQANFCHDLQLFRLWLSAQRRCARQSCAGLAKCSAQR